MGGGGGYTVSRSILLYHESVPPVFSFRFRCPNMIFMELVFLLQAARLRVFVIYIWSFWSVGCLFQPYIYHTGPTMPVTFVASFDFLTRWAEYIIARTWLLYKSSCNMSAIAYARCLGGTLTWYRIIQSLKMEGGAYTGGGTPTVCILQYKVPVQSQSNPSPVLVLVTASFDPHV